MAIGDDRIESMFDPLAIGLRDDQRRKQLHGKVCVARDLNGSEPGGSGALWINRG
jgi:hypothetical protein